MKEGDPVRLIKTYDGLLAGSEGVIVIYRGHDDDQGIRITKALWDCGSTKVEKGHECGEPNLFPAGDGYWVNDSCLELIEEKETIDVDADYICSMMPWEIEELKSKEE